MTSDMNFFYLPNQVFIMIYFFFSLWSVMCISQKLLLVMPLHEKEKVLNLQVYISEKHRSLIFPSYTETIQ